VTAAALPLLAALAAVPGDADARAALELLYDGSTATALARLGGLAAAAPDDPMGAYLVALALCWRIEQRPESTDLDKDFEAQVDRAIALADARLKKDRRDARAWLARGAAHGVRGRLLLGRAQRRQAAREAARMRADLLVAHDLDPDDGDVLFGLGLYDYYADVLPRVSKLLRFLAGLPGGDRERGIARIEGAKGAAALHRTEAQWQLYEIYAFYEGDADRAYEEIRELHARYPGSPLWALKQAEHERMRLGLYARSGELAGQVLAEAERGHANYSPVVAAMARAALGEALLLDLRTAEARRVLLQVERVPDAPWLESIAHLLLGRCLELEGDRASAAAHYRLASSSPQEETRRRASRALSSPMDRGQVEALQLVGAARRLREAGRHGDAADAYRRALALWPACDEARLRAAEDDLRAGRLEEARQALASLVTRKEPDPPWLRPWARLLLGQAHDLAGQRSAAVHEYKEVLQHPLGHEELRREAAAGLLHPHAPAAAVPTPPAYSK